MIYGRALLSTYDASCITFILSSDAFMSTVFDLLTCSVWRTFQRDALIVNLSFHKRFLLTARFQDFYSAYFTRFQDSCLHMLFLRHDDRFFSTVENVFLADQIDQSSFSHFFEYFRLHARQIHLGAVPFQFFYKIDHSLDA